MMNDAPPSGRTTAVAGSLSGAFSSGPRTPTAWEQNAPLLRWRARPAAVAGWTRRIKHFGDRNVPIEVKGESADLTPDALAVPIVLPAPTIITGNAGGGGAQILSAG